jgi:hypothetical protein
MVFDDWVETVHSGPEFPPDKWEDMCTFQQWEVVFDEGHVPQLKDEWLSLKEVEEWRFRRGQGTQPEATRRRIYQDLQTRENREDMSFQPPVTSPPRSPLAALPPNSPNTNLLSPPKQ